MLPYHFTNIFSIMLDKNLNMTTLKCFGNVMCLQGIVDMKHEWIFLHNLPTINAAFSITLAGVSGIL